VTATAGRSDPLPGRTLGDFVVRGRIGQGAFGAVYLADQVGLGRVAVVKVLHAALRAEAAGRFLQEARLLARLDHPYAAHVYAFGAEPDGLLWIAMERVDGTPLDRLLEIKGPFAFDGFLPFFERLCEVVSAAHERGIVHRDIKPSNVMVLCRAGRFTPKLLDLGVARLLSRGDDPGGAAEGEDLARTQAGALVGTPVYLAPEAWEDASASSAAVDIYALGVLAFEALTGERPFVGASLAAIRAAHQAGRIPPLGPRFPAELDAVLARAMARDPAARFAGALDFASAFRRASGLAEGGDALPRLDPTLAETFVASAPQPIAEAIALLAGARNAHQARDALRQVARVVTRWIGAVALACRAQVSTGDPPTVQGRLRALRRGELPDAEWIALASDLSRPFTSLREAYPVPELVDFFHGPDPAARDALAALLGGVPPAVSEAQAREALEREIAGLAALLGGLAVVHEYPLVVGAGEVAEPWMGLRRRRRALVPLLRPLEAGQVGLIDGDARPIVTLSPLVQLAAPAPGADPELFFLAGGGRRGARLVALPAGFEHEDEEVWRWLRDLLADLDADVRPVTSEEKSPYRGLAAFGSSDADLFLGREREVEAFVNRLRIDPILAVVGPSGAGKSSFVAAGVAPALAVADSRQVISMRPGPHPVAALEARLAAAGDTDRLVLAVDQFEELFTLGADTAEQHRFAELLAGLAPSIDQPTRVILTVRDDFLMRCVELPALRPHLARGLVLLGTPAPDDLHRILVEPAALQGYELEADLADEMIRAVADVPAALPLLSFTADRLWQLRDRRFRQLGRGAYQAMGGVAGALARHAETTLAAMSPGEQSLAREAFRHLVTAEGTRAVLSRPELLQLLGHSHAEAVLEQLIAARLVSASEGDEGADQVEITHEALLAAWPRLAGWLVEDREGARLRDQIRAAARQWQSGGRPRGLLWRDDVLAGYRRWRADHPAGLTESEEAFAAASLADERRGRRVRRLVVGAIIAALAAGLVLLYGANQRTAKQHTIAVAAGERARSSAETAEHRLIDLYREQGRDAVLAGDDLRGLAYLAQAFALGADDFDMRMLVARARPAVDMLAADLVGHTANVTSCIFSPDGKAILSSSDDGTVRLWDAATGAPRITLATGPLAFVEMVPGSTDRIFAIGSGEAFVLDAATGERLVTLPRHQHSAIRHDLSRDGRFAVTAGRDGIAQVSDLATGTLLATLPHGGYIDAVAFSPDGERIATGSDDRAVKLWDRRGRLVWTAATRPRWVQVVAFSPDGKRLLAGGGDGDAVVSVFDVASGRTAALLSGHTDYVASARYSPDGDRIFTGSLDGTARMWDAASGRLLRTFSGHERNVGIAALAAGGRRLITSGQDGTVRLWESESGVPLSIVAAHAVGMKAIKASPSGDAIVTCGMDGHVKLWRPRLDPMVATLAGHEGSVTSARFDREGGRVVTCSDDGTIGLWDARTGERLASRRVAAAMRYCRADLAPDGRHVAVSSQTSNEVAVLDLTDEAAAVARLIGHQAGTTDVAWDRAGRIASGGRDGTVRLWQDGRMLRSIEQPAPEVQSIAFSPDGARLAIAAGSTASLFDPESGERLVELRGHEDGVRSVAFSSDGRQVVTASRDEAARVFDAASGSLVLTLRARGVPLERAAFSADGRAVVTAGYDASVQVWSTSSRRRVALFRGHDGNLIRWTDFAPDGWRLLSAGVDGRVRIWSLPPDDRKAGAIAEWIGCRVGLHLDTQGRVVDGPARTDCAQALRK
jgi:WD40 repeat protein